MLGAPARFEAEDLDTVELSPEDLDGGPRFVDATADAAGCGVPVIVDMGALERDGTPAGRAVHLAGAAGDGDGT